MKPQLSRSITVAIALLMCAEAAFAGTGGAYIDGIKQFFVELLQGTGGMVIGLAGLLYGLVVGIPRGSLAGIGGGFGLAAGSYYGPDIIMGMASMTLMTL